MKYNPNILSFLFMCIAYLVRNTLRTHPIFVLSISLFALLGTFSFINPMEDTYFPLLILIGVLMYFILLLSTLLIEVLMR